MRVVVKSLLGIFLACSVSFAANNSVDDFSQAEKNYDAGKYKEAEVGYRQALIQYPHSFNLTAYIKSQIGVCCQNQGKIEDAVQFYRKVQADHADAPTAGQMQSRIARAYYMNKNFEKAAPEFEKLADQMGTQQKAAAASIDSNKTKLGHQTRQNEALAYAAFCHHKAGHYIQAAVIGAKIKFDQVLNKK